MTKDTAQYNGDSEEFKLKSKKLDIEAGILGKIFGNENNAPLNIAGFIACIAIIVGMVILFFPGDKLSISAKEYWEIFAPIITLILGYLFGKKGMQ